MINNLLLAAVVLQVSYSHASNNVRTPGTVDGFQTVDKDGIVDAALVIPTLSPSEVFRFDIEGLLGPDERAKAGPISADVPGNTFIPRQKEKYGILTVTLEKDNFGFYAPARRQNEISALWFSAPFSVLLDASKGKVNPADLLKSARFRKLGFAGLKDWSRESKIYLSLDRELRSLGQAKWTRGQAPAGSNDMMVVFQSTPAQRWALTGFNGAPGSQMSFTSVDGFSPRLKVLAIRSRFSGQDVVAAEGWIVEAERRSKVNFTGLPSALQGTKITGRKVLWKSLSGEGWMGVIHQPQNAAKRNENPSFFDGLFPIRKILPDAAAGSTITWVEPRAGESTLPSSYRSGDKVMLVHVGTPRPVAAPKESDLEPELFTYAESLRSVVVK